MAGLADIYAREYATPDRFVDRNETGKAMLGLIPHSGYAGPALALAAGQEMKAGQEDEAKTRQVRSFLATFEKLASIDQGEAVAFANKVGPQVMPDGWSPITGIQRKGEITSTIHENGMVLGSGPQGLYMPEGNGSRWAPATPEYLKQFADKAKDKTDKTSGLQVQKEGRQILAQINSIDKGIAFISRPDINRDTLMQYAKDNPDMAAFVESGKTVMEMKEDLLSQREELRTMYKKVAGRNPWKGEKKGTELLKPPVDLNMGDFRFGTPGAPKPKSTGAFRSLIGG